MLEKRVGQSIEGNDVTTFDYYPNGNKKSMIYSSGITEEYSYNKNNMLTSLINLKGTTKISEYNYKYNDAGKISTKIDNKGTTTYNYDSLNRLKSVTEPTKTTSYLYDKSGNRKQETINQNGKTYIKNYNYHEGLNLLNSVETKEGTTIIGTRSYSYDKTGNMINERVTAKSVILPQGANLTVNEILENPNKIEENISKATDNEVVARAVKELTMGQIRNTLEATETNIKYEYDIFNDMTKATDLNTDKTLVENKYNAEGLRVSKESDGEKTGYIYEGQNPIVELNLNATGKATVKASNEYVGDTVISKTIGNEKYNYLYNGHGDVVNLIDNKGTIKNTYYYDAFGVVEESVENVDNNFKYSKYEYDKETGKYYLKSRMYDPNTARFMQEDTYRGKTNDPLSLNLYTYCVNEPIMYYDPDGHFPVLAMLIGAGLGATIGLGINFGIDYFDDRQINSGWKSYAGAAAGGAITGALTPFIASLGLSALPGGALYLGANALGTAAEMKIADGRISFSALAATVVMDLGFDGAGKVGKSVFKKMASSLEPVASKVLSKSSDSLKDITSSLFKKVNANDINKINSIAHKIGFYKDNVGSIVRGAVDNFEFSPKLSFAGTPNNMGSKVNINFAQIIPDIQSAFRKSIDDVKLSQINNGYNKISSKFIGKDLSFKWLSENYKAVNIIGTVKVGGKIRDISRRVYQRIDIDWDYISSHPDALGRSNRDLAKQGNAPFHIDDTRIELHHLTQTEPGAMVEIPGSLHDEYTKTLHGLVDDGGSFRNDQVLDKQYNNFKSKYWRWRVKQGK